MRIAFLTPEYPTEKSFSGGLASYLKRTARCLKVAGHEPEIFTISDRTERIVDDDVVVHRVSDGIGSYTLRTIVDRSRFGPLSRLYLNPLKLYLRFLRENVRRRFDILQAPNFLATGYFAAKFGTVPVVTRISSFTPLVREAYNMPSDPGRAALERTEIVQIIGSSGVYAPSQLLSRILKARENIEVEVINPPVAVAAPPAERDESYATYALFFGSIGALKGCDRLLNVLPRLLEKNQDYSFVFVGPFRHEEDRPRYEALLRDRRYGGRVKVLKERQGEELRRLIGNARYVVLPSKIDNFPNTCIEAMLLRRVVVATVDASFEEIIDHGVNGYLVSQSDDEELFSTMDAVWQMERDQLERMGDVARASLDRLAPEHTIGRLLAYYERVIDTAAKK